MPTGELRLIHVAHIPLLVDTGGRRGTQGLRTGTKEDLTPRLPRHSLLSNCHTFWVAWEKVDSWCLTPRSSRWPTPGRAAGSLRWRMRPGKVAQDRGRPPQSVPFAHTRRSQTPITSLPRAQQEVLGVNCKHKVCALSPRGRQTRQLPLSGRQGPRQLSTERVPHQENQSVGSSGGPLGLERVPLVHDH